MKTTIQTFRIGNQEINFFFDQNSQPIIEVSGSSFNNLQDLFRKHPELNEAENFDKLTQMINFLAKGLEFHIIGNIEAFKQDYRERFEAREVELLDDSDDRISEFFRYDVSGMHPPRVVNGKLVFFTKHDYTGIPYAVVVNHPLTGELDISYQLLPYL